MENVEKTTKNKTLSRQLLVEIVEREEEDCYQDSNGLFGGWKKTIVDR